MMGGAAMCHPNIAVADDIKDDPGAAEAVPGDADGGGVDEGEALDVVDGGPDALHVQLGVAAPECGVAAPHGAVLDGEVGREAVDVGSCQGGQKVHQQQQ